MLGLSEKAAALPRQREMRLQEQCFANTQRHFEDAALSFLRLFFKLPDNERSPAGVLIYPGGSIPAKLGVTLQQS